jgi:glycosyltransferase involved in cell wall biosynthesis
VTSRLLIVCHDLRAGGLAIDIANEANAMTARGWSVSIATIARDENARFRERVEPSIRTIELPPVRPAGVGRRVSLARGLGRIVDEHADLVHIVSCVPAVLEGAAFGAARRCQRPIAWTPMFHPARRRYWHGPIRRPAMTMFDLLAPHASRWANVVLAATQEEAAAFRAAGARAVELVPPAVDDTAPRTVAEAATFRDAIGVGDAPMLLVVASRAERRKGLDFARSTFAHVAGEVPDARLVVVGGGSPRSHASRSLIELGYVPDAHLRSALAAADVVFVPSRFEAFSRVVIEAWHEGTAVVVSDGVGLRDEVRRSGVCPVRFGDVPGAAGTLVSLLRDRSSTTRIGERGRAIHRRYLMDAVSEQMDRTFRALLRRSGEAQASDRIRLPRVRA